MQCQFFCPIGKVNSSCLLYWEFGLKKNAVNVVLCESFTVISYIFFPGPCWAFRNPEGFSHLGAGWCVSTAGCMIRPGRLVILASSGGEVWHLFFKAPTLRMKNACLKLSQGGLGNHLCQCLQSHVSTLLVGCLTGDAWCLTLQTPTPIPTPPLHAMLLSRTASSAAPAAPAAAHCQSVPPLISTCQVQTLTWSQLTILSSLLPPSKVPQVFFFSYIYTHTLLWTFTAPPEPLPCLSSLYATPPFICEDILRFVIHKDRRHKLHVTQWCQT